MQMESERASTPGFNMWLGDLVPFKLKKYADSTSHFESCLGDWWSRNIDGKLKNLRFMGRLKRLVNPS